MTDRPAVVVIVPCFNTARFVADAVESALRQTYPLEIVVVNDGSTDGFETAIAPLREKIRVIDQGNRGLGAARNRGIDETTGELLAFLDADDRWHPEKIERQVAFLTRQPDVCVVHTGRRYIDGNGRPTEAPSPVLPLRPAEDSCLPDLVLHNTVLVSSTLLRRSALGSERFVPRLNGCEDWDLWLRLAMRGRFGYLDQPLTDYRVHPGGMSRSRERMVAGRVAVMDRLLARGAPPAVLAAAQRNRQSALRFLAHLEYERGDFLRARELFRQCPRALGPADLARLAATYLPSRILPTARAIWRAARTLGPTRTLPQRDV